MARNLQLMYLERGSAHDIERRHIHAQSSPHHPASHAGSLLSTCMACPANRLAERLPPSFPSSRPCRPRTRTQKNKARSAEHEDWPLTFTMTSGSGLPLLLERCDIPARWSSAERTFRRVRGAVRRGRLSAIKLRHVGVTCSPGCGKCRCRRSHRPSIPCPYASYFSPLFPLHS